MTTTTTHRPEWADCIVLQCTRCGNRVAMSWEQFDHISTVNYEPGDMPVRIVGKDCVGPGASCKQYQSHFVDLDPNRMIRTNRGGHLRDRAARVCGCRECKNL